MIHKKYKIEKGDTLESISKKLNIQLFELRTYHNKYCELNNLIGNKIPSHVKEIIYLPKEEAISQEFSQIKENSHFNLLLIPPISKSTIYEAQVSYFENELEQNIKFQIKMDWLQRNLFRITRKNLFINYESPNLLADLLAIKVAEVIYPLELIINPKGEIYKLSNYAEIKARWESLKPELTKEYKGEYFEKYISLNDSTFSDEYLLYNSLKKDWLLQAYFNGLYQTYPAAPLAGKLTFPLIPSIPAIQYDVESRINTIDEEGEKLIKIEIRGEISDERSPSDFETESFFPFSHINKEDKVKSEGKYKGKYFLDIENKMIIGLYLECTLNLEKTKKAYITLMEIKNKIKKGTIKEEGMIVIGQKELPPSNKNSFLFD